MDCVNRYRCAVAFWAHICSIWSLHLALFAFHFRWIRLLLLILPIKIQIVDYYWILILCTKLSSNCSSRDTKIFCILPDLVILDIFSWEKNVFHCTVSNVWTIVLFWAQIMCNITRHKSSILLNLLWMIQLRVWKIDCVNRYRCVVALRAHICSIWTLHLAL